MKLINIATQPQIIPDAVRWFAQKSKNDGSLTRCYIKTYK